MKFLSLFYVFLSVFSFAQSSQLGQGYEFEANGKNNCKQTDFESTYKLDTFQTKVKIANTKYLQKGLASNLKYLNRTKFKTYNLKGPKFSTTSIKELTTSLTEIDSLDLSTLKLYKLAGEDKIGSVHYTSYYIPTLKVSKIRDSIYKYPIYKCPTSKSEKQLSRFDIDVKLKLKNKGLELAYAKNYFDLFSMMIQGSGYVNYKDGSKQLFSYGGKNHKDYYSIGKYLIEKKYISAEAMSLNALKKWFSNHPDSTHIFMKNKSYVFFKPNNKIPKGACSVPLIKHCSVAADFKYLPKGSLLLGKIPVLDSDGNFLKHQYNILMVHDTGSAIKGPGHIDLYAGEGEESENYASGMHHYGELWLILP